MYFESLNVVEIVSVTTLFLKSSETGYSTTAFPDLSVVTGVTEESTSPQPVVTGSSARSHEALSLRPETALPLASFTVILNTVEGPIIPFAAEIAMLRFSTIIEQTDSTFFEYNSVPPA